MSPWISMPLYAALVGTATNWVAIQLTLHPARPLTLGPFRWQGALPRKAAAVASRFAQQSLQQVIGLERLVATVDADALAREMDLRLDSELNNVVAATLRSVNPKFWDSLRPEVQALWQQRLRASFPRVLRRVLDLIQSDPQRYIDLPGLVADRVSAEPQILSEVIWATGHRQLRFIEWSGALFGAPLGLLTAALWPLWPHALLGGIGGALIGGLTNWVAVVAVFDPAEPRQIGPWRLQGLIYRHQSEVSAQLTSFFVEHMITPGALIDHLNRPGGHFQFLCREAVRAELDQAAQGSSTVVAMSLGARTMNEALDAMSKAITEGVPPLLRDLRLSEELQRDSRARLMRELSELPPKTYGDLMRSALREDEPMLIAAGALIGFITGLLGPLLM